MQIKSLQDLNLNELITSNEPTLSAHMYSDEQYLDAISRIQQHSYKDPKIEWGIRWRQILANSFPFILKLLNKGYNDFHVFAISSRRPSWIQYSEEEFIKYNRSIGIPLEVYHFGVAYKKYKANAASNKYKWVKLTQLFQNRAQETTNGYAHDTMARYLNNLAEVGAIAKVCNAYTDLDNHYLYSSRFICSKEKLRELISLFISTFYTTITHSSLSSSLSTYSSSYIFNPLLGTTKGGRNGKCAQMYTVDELINRNNEILPEEEQMVYNGRRIYAECCSYWNEEKHDNIPAGQMTKQRYCDKVFGHNNWFEFDRRGSIYNLTKSLNEHTYLDNSIDIYEKMNNIQFVSKEERNLYKLTQMNVYFSTAKRTIRFFEIYLTQLAEGTPIPSNKKQLIDAWWKLCGGENVTWNDFIYNFRVLFNKRRLNMKKFIGDNKWLIDDGSKYSKSHYIKNEDSFIFQYESEIYLEFVTKLRERGLRVVQIYDGFYLEKGSISETELNNLLKDIIIAYASK